MKSILKSCIAVFWLASVALVANAQGSKQLLTLSDKAPLRCEGVKPVKIFVGFLFTGTTTDKRATGGGGQVLCWDREVDTEAEIVRLHDAMEVNPRVTKVTIVSIMKLRS